MSKHKPGYVATILVNLALIYLAVYLRDHRPSFLTESYLTVLPVWLVSLGATTLANAAFLFYDRAWFKHLLQIGLHAVSISVMAVLYSIFPFALDQPWPLIIRAMLVLGMAGAAIGILVELAGLVRGCGESGALKPNK